MPNGCYCMTRFVSMPPLLPRLLPLLLLLLLPLLAHAEETTEVVYSYVALRDGPLDYQLVNATTHPDCAVSYTTAGTCGYNREATLFQGCSPDRPVDAWIRLGSIDMRSRRRFGAADGEFRVPKSSDALVGHIRGFFPSQGNAPCKQIGTGGTFRLELDDDSIIDDPTDSNSLENFPVLSQGYDTDALETFDRALPAALRENTAYIYGIVESNDSGGGVMINELHIELVMTDEMPEEEQQLLAETTLEPDFVPVYVNTFDSGTGPEATLWHDFNDDIMLSTILMHRPDGSCEHDERALGSINARQYRVDRGATITLDDLQPHDLIEMHVEAYVYAGAEGETDDDQVHLYLDGALVFASTASTEEEDMECWPHPPGCPPEQQQPAFAGAHRTLFPGDCVPPEAGSDAGWYFINVTVPHKGSQAEIKLTKNNVRYFTVRMASIVVAVHPVSGTSSPVLPLWLLITILVGGTIVAGIAIVVILRSTATLAAGNGGGGSGLAVKSSSDKKKKHHQRDQSQGKRSVSSKQATSAASLLAVEQSMLASPDASMRTGTSRNARSGSRSKLGGKAKKRLSFESSATMMTSGSAVSTYGSGDDYGHT